VQIGVNVYLKGNYDNKPACGHGKNKANSKPIASLRWEILSKPNGAMGSAGKYSKHSFCQLICPVSQGPVGGILPSVRSGA